MKTFANDHEFVWFFGVVEDVNDPELLGRCRVRCFGIHTSAKNNIPTEDLPWAHPMQPITSAAISGIGTSPTGIRPGTHVVGFFRDGSLCQQPVIMGTVGGIPQEAPNPSVGFNDPDGVFPTEEYVGIPDTNKLAYGETNEVVSSKLQRASENINHPTPSTYVETTGVDDKWSEPPTPYRSQYPYNHVKQTLSGHIEEFDDTPNAERIHTYHKSGTFEEVHPDGSVVNNIVANEYHIVEGKEYVHVKDAANVMIGPTNGDGSKTGHTTVYITGNADIEVVGNLNATVNKNANINSKETITANAEKGIFVNSESGFNIQDGERFSIATKNGDVKIQSIGNLDIVSGKNVTIRGQYIDFNP